MTQKRFGRFLSVLSGNGAVLCAGLLVLPVPVPASDVQLALPSTAAVVADAKKAV